MSVMQTIFSSLGLNSVPAGNPNPNATPVPAAPVQPGNIPQQQNNPAAANNPTVPAASAAATATTEQPQGLDKFTDMWNIPEDNKPKQPESAFKGITPEAIKEVAGKTDFSKVVTQEMMQAISGGGEGAAAAMIQALNATSQQVYAQSAEASMKLIDTALTKQREHFVTELPNLIKSQTVTENLRNTNPVFKNPAAAPLVNMIQKTLQEKNPTASADEIKQQAVEYFNVLTSSLQPQQSQQGSNSKKDPATDFSDWL